jgi:hypothetical protein
VVRDDGSQPVGASGRLNGIETSGADEMIMRIGLLLLTIGTALAAVIVYVSDHYGELIHYAVAGSEILGRNCPTPPDELMRDLDRRQYHESMEQYHRAMSSFPQHWLCSKEFHE